MPDDEAVRRVRVDPETCAAADLTAAAAWLAGGGIVAFPTETVYGLAVDPRSGTAVAGLFALKGRAFNLALPLVAASLEAIERALGPLDARSRRLADGFWPGPLSLIVPAPEAIASDVHGGVGTVAVRVPSHAVARALAQAAGGLVTATSANRHGEPPAVRVEDLGSIADDPRVLVVDGGEAPGGLPSTIVDARPEMPVLVRAGAVSWERVLQLAAEKRSS
jgi:L-threonylcarbamoyladenylate synthase